MKPDLGTDSDRSQMRRALALAERGLGMVSPNPPVGAVIARGEEVLGEGWHQRHGQAHAEVAAIADASRGGTDLDGATIYVSLEPCAHFGRQPPCSEAIIAAGLGRVVIGASDPSDKADGRGPGALREAGVAVEFIDGPEAAAAVLLVQPFRKHSRTGQPLVILKAAVSLDGRTATVAGDSQWISCEASREAVHRWRATVDAVVVGIGTALADDPLLTARGVDAASQPRRVILDSSARLPLDGQLLATVAEAPVIVVASPKAPTERVEALVAAGAEVISCTGDGPARIDAALHELGARGVTSLILEGGPTIAGSFLDADAIDEVRLFLAPMLLGGADARPLLAGVGLERLADARRAVDMDWQACGEDLLIRARMREW